ncbi:hypothetical protein P43SY_002127 [Pythium insidiosum]|uniref:Uncharacterized protein n=1 Tax=Pythium insidiosum TaxID=114742 RepID=A0AAD5QCB7_PYTIN|nr:hypothetical protein P43SY_002127 [Pythium insidiosum]
MRAVAGVLLYGALLHAAPTDATMYGMRAPPLSPSPAPPTSTSRLSGMYGLGNRGTNPAYLFDGHTDASGPSASTGAPGDKKPGSSNAVVHAFASGDTSTPPSSSRLFAFERRTPTLPPTSTATEQHKGFTFTDGQYSFERVTPLRKGDPVTLPPSAASIVPGAAPSDSPPRAPIRRPDAPSSRLDPAAPTPTTKDGVAYVLPPTRPPSSDEQSVAAPTRAPSPPKTPQPAISWPEPAPEPAPAPKPAVKPEPRPQPMPQPKPRPNPVPLPAPVPGPSPSQCLDRFRLQGPSLSQCLGRFRLQDQSPSQRLDRFRLQDQSPSQRLDRFRLQDQSLSQCLGRFRLQGQSLSQCLGRFRLQDQSSGQRMHLALVVLPDDTILRVSFGVDTTVDAVSRCVRAHVSPNGSVNASFALFLVREQREAAQATLPPRVIPHSNATCPAAAETIKRL